MIQSRSSRSGRWTPSGFFNMVPTVKDKRLSGWSDSLSWLTCFTASLPVYHRLIFPFQQSTKRKSQLPFNQLSWTLKMWLRQKLPLRGEDGSRDESDLIFEAKACCLSLFQLCIKKDSSFKIAKLVFLIFQAAVKTSLDPAL